LCIIVDINVASQVLIHQSSDYMHIRDVLLVKRSNQLVYGGKLGREYIKNNEVRRLVSRMDAAGSARKIPDEEVDGEAKAPLLLSVCVSDDQHIIALARISGARILCSEDSDLCKDFKNPRLISNPRGNVYKRGSHRPIVGQKCRYCKKHRTMLPCCDS